MRECVTLHDAQETRTECTAAKGADRSMSKHCCERMDWDLDQKCDMHKNRYDCPDFLIAVVRGGYGLIVHDGGSSVIQINFCPWCGAELPKIRRFRAPHGKNRIVFK